MPIDGRWATEQVWCNRCGHVWVAVYPAVPGIVLECGKCGYQQPASVVADEGRKVVRH